MKNENELPKLGKKGTVAGLVLSFVAMITLVGVYTFGQYQDNVEDELAELEFVEEQKAALEESMLEESVLDEVQKAEEANTSQIINEEPSVVQEEVSNPIAEAPEEVTTTNEPIASQASFTEDSSMVWPIDGGIIMMYNMDNAVYFETLDQYKRNPAMIIEGEVGTEVLAAERGTVECITNEADTGNTVTVDMGNGYIAVYGQLDDLKVSTGSYVEKGQVIGALTEPTKYYSLEGCNLYFQMLKDGESVDPLDYLVD